MRDLADFAADLLHRSRLARDENDGHPFGTWSTGERLAVALILGDQSELDYEEYTVAEAERRLVGELASVYGYLGDVGAWLDEIRKELARDA